ncbi:26S proteasome non-ATPase regulatory subunit 13-like [Schistocerca gregaria]|uniref:26S proteasome non-ATPase regulatory subunit 13-like n=1 Tax=Schistocerca gregaria TaxID=7010 RepID=UPI00211E6A80|nr:26S proteasome non-ATPase regulatory subunit 13-like [Schistocerca gregaria]
MKVAENFSKISKQLPEHGEIIARMQQFHEKKLWHQLTEEIVKFIWLDNIAARIDLVQFYNEVVLDFAPRMNQLRLCQIASEVCYHMTDPKKKLEFYEKLSSANHITDDAESHIFALSLYVRAQVENGLITEAMAVLDECETKLSDLNYADSCVHAAYYRAKAALYQYKQDFSEFYSNGLQYLAYAQVEMVHASDLETLALDLAYAALVGENIYNFGELIESQILNYIKGGPSEWVWQTIEMFSKGDIEGWESLKSRCSNQLCQLFHGNYEILNQKMATLAVIELIFNRRSSDKNISFSDIMNVSRIGAEEVELLLMKALSLGLIRGRINETEQFINVTWVRPRVLLPSQIEAMKNRLDRWGETVKDALNLIENQMTPELIS